MKGRRGRKEKEGNERKERKERKGEEEKERKDFLLIRTESFCLIITENIVFHFKK